MASRIDPKDLRVSDAERSHVLSLLEKATGRGLIDLAEYTERSAQAIAARTRGELNALLLDLPGLRLSDGDGAVAPRARPATDGFRPSTPVEAAAAGHPANGSVLELTGWGSRTFKGYWTAPPLIVIGGTGASTKLDFTQARLISPTVTVEFRSNYGGAAEFIVPPGSRVRFDGLQVRGGSINNKVPPADRPPEMTLILTGLKKAGSVTLRLPRQLPRWF